LLNSRTDSDWEWYGKNDPYYGVVSWDQFRSDQLDEQGRAAFFQAGEAYVRDLTEQIRRLVVGEFCPGRVLDHGCGVGRITIPLARLYPEVVGADISPSMLGHARENCRAMGIGNAEFVDAGEVLRGRLGQFDFIHSYIVFQHIPVGRGYEITQALLGLLAAGGVGALHFTYRRSAGRHLRSRLLPAVYRRVPYAYRLRRLLKREPVMQMNEYDLNQILTWLHDIGCGGVNLRFTDHGVRGAILVFRKQNPASKNEEKP
jgi:2-polyprenyl-3-methyl-5-hydroxy-6-metoxy-1,4-benzoquinol methylase